MKSPGMRFISVSRGRGTGRPRSSREMRHIFGKRDEQPTNSGSSYFLIKFMNLLAFYFIIFFFFMFFLLALRSSFLVKRPSRMPLTLSSVMSWLTQA